MESSLEATLVRAAEPTPRLDHESRRQPARRDVSVSGAKCD